MSDEPTNKSTPEPVPCLEALLSLEPILSDPIEVKFGGQATHVVLREIPNDTKNRLKMAAIQHVENARVEREKHGGNEWRNAAADLDVLKMEEQDLRILHAALTDPVTHGPAVSLETMRYHMGSNLQEFLGQKYEEHEAGINPDGATDEMIQALLDDVKKNEDLVSLWTRYGSLTALRCVQFLAAQVEMYQTAQSSTISTGKKRRTRKPKK